MRIVHIAPFVAPGGQSGGPTRVALDQLAELKERGHDVLLVVGAHGFAELPREIEGIPVQAFRTRSLPRAGFAGLYASGLRRWLESNIASIDVLHIHMGRDLTSLPAAAAARRLGRHYFLQTHGMVTPSNRLLARAIDWVWTRRNLQSAVRVMCLSQREVVDIENVSRSAASTVVLRNGVKTSLSIDPAQRELNVLFLARLHERKRPQLFVEMAIELSPKFPNVTFSLVGPDEGEADAVLALIHNSGLGGRVSWEGAIEPAEVIARMGRSVVYVLSAREEPFGLTVLEAMLAGTPVVIDRSSVLAEMIERTDSGTVFSGGLSALAAAVSEYLADPSLVRIRGTNGRAEVKRTYSIARVVDELESIYRAGNAPRNKLR